MKTLSRIVIFVLMLSVLATGVSAANSTSAYDLPNLKMTVYIPEEYVTFTRDRMEVSDLNAYGLTKDGFLPLMEERNIYLNAWDTTVTHELVVTMIESPLNDFGAFDDSTLEIMASSCAAEYEKVGVKCVKSEIYQNSQTKYIKIYISQPSGDLTVYGLQYYTVYDGKAINFTLHSYSGQINTSQEKMLKEMVDSTKFYTAPDKPAGSKNTPSFTYHDDESGLEFAVPANWTEAEMTENRETLDAKFTSNESSALILFASMNAWDSLSSEEKAGMSKADVNNSFFNTDDIAEVFGCNEGAVIRSQYGGKDYYKATWTAANTVAGITLATPVTGLFRAENGYCYMFWFYGIANGDQFDDFVELVKSATYPVINDTNNDYVVLNEYAVLDIIFSLVITAVIYSLPIIIYRYAIRKAAVERKRAKKIAVIYGVCAFVVMSVLLALLNGEASAGISILLWSWINYRVLISGELPSTSGSANDDDCPLVATSWPATERLADVESSTSIKNETMALSTTEDEPSSVTQVEPDSDAKTRTVEEAATQPISKSNMITRNPQIAFCHKCGSRLVPESCFCNKCGARILTEEDF